MGKEIFVFYESNNLKIHYSDGFRKKEIITTTKTGTLHTFNVFTEELDFTISLTSFELLDLIENQKELDYLKGKQKLTITEDIAERYYSILLRFYLSKSNKEIHEKLAKKYVDDLYDSSKTLFHKYYEEFLSTWITYNHNATVNIVSPDDNIPEFINDRLIIAVGNFMEELGFSYKGEEEPIYGSFFKSLNFFKKDSSKKEINDIYKKGKSALEHNFVDLPAAEVTEKLATSSAALLQAISPYDNVAIRLGQILAIKTTNGDGTTNLMVETVSPELAKLFNDNPGLLNEPKLLFEKIKDIAMEDRKGIAEGDESH
ncbi:hypothetical protein [Aquimarina sp. Aq78]|uniref:hypothetical protein n=1 Tax=Aquimarina sp. Aq78 TaxID=1191889 RepID=UPI000D106723|nr:hypothetical protein [Aquimarina sp. Aq78]